MEEEIDIRLYIRLLVKRWYWIVGAAILAGLIAFGVTSLQDPIYEATALVAVTSTADQVQFEPRIRNSDDIDRPLKILPELAMSDGVLVDLKNDLNESLINNGITNIMQLRGMLSASPGLEPNLIHLTVQHSDPSVAASISSSWALLFISHANEVFGFSFGSELSFFERQLLDAEGQLNIADEGLIEFQSLNRSKIIENELNSLTLAQESNLNKEQRFTALQQDIAGLIVLLSQQSDDSVTYADQLTALLVQLNAFYLETEDEIFSPYQFQIDTAGSFTDGTGQEQIASLETLSLSLEARNEEIENTLSLLEPKILALQRDMQKDETEFNNLTRDIMVAEETFLALARKVDEERIASDINTTGIRLASQASIPERPVGPRSLVTGAIVGLISCILVSILILANDWWKQKAPETSDEVNQLPDSPVDPPALPISPTDQSAD